MARRVVQFISCPQCKFLPHPVTYSPKFCVVKHSVFFSYSDRPVCSKMYPQLISESPSALSLFDLSFLSLPPVLSALKCSVEHKKSLQNLYQMQFTSGNIDTPSLGRQKILASSWFPRGYWNLFQLFSASVALCCASPLSISIFVRDELVAVATTQFPASSDRALADWLAVSQSPVWWFLACSLVCPTPIPILIEDIEENSSSWAAGL